MCCTNMYIVQAIQQTYSSFPEVAQLVLPQYEPSRPPVVPHVTLHVGEECKAVVHHKRVLCVCPQRPDHKACGTTITSAAEVPTPDETLQDLYYSLSCIACLISSTSTTYPQHV